MRSLFVRYMAEAAVGTLLVVFGFILGVMVCDLPL